MVDHNATVNRLAVSNVPLEIFKEYVTGLKNNEMLDVGRYVPASWYGWPPIKESAKAEFFIIQLNRVLAHRGMTIISYMELIRPRPQRAARGAAP